MSQITHKIAVYKKISLPKGNKYRFYCSLSGALVCETEVICMESDTAELEFAWEEIGKRHFNQCHKCGKWVSNVMFNADVLQCVDCAPWENQPNFCSRCGCRVSIEDIFCKKCGIRLRYGEVMSDED